MRRALVLVLILLSLVVGISNAIPSPYVSQDGMVHPASYQTSPYSYNLGRDVDLEGDILVAGGYIPGKNGGIFIFKRVADTWVEIQRFGAPATTPNYSEFGSAVALSRPWLVIGAENANRTFQVEGAVYVYKEQPDGTFAYHSELLAADLFPLIAVSWFGRHLDINEEGNRIVVGMPHLDVDVDGDNQVNSNTGGIYEFVYNPNDDSWSGENFYSPTLVTNNPADLHFGADVAVHGSTIVAGFKRQTGGEIVVLEGGAYKYQVTSYTPFEDFGRLSLDINASWIAVGDQNGGRVFSYDADSASQVYSRSSESPVVGLGTAVAFDEQNRNKLAIASASTPYDIKSDGYVEVWEAVNDVWSPTGYYRGYIWNAVGGFCCFNVAIDNGLTAYGNPRLQNANFQNGNYNHGVIYLHWTNTPKPEDQFRKLSVGNGTVTETDSNVQISIPVTLDLATESTVTFTVNASSPVAVAGKDYILDTVTGTIEVGQSTTNILITIIGDNGIEAASEGIQLDITNLVNAHPFDMVGNLIIWDDDNVSIANAGFENGLTSWKLTKKSGTPTNDKWVASSGLGANGSNSYIKFKGNRNEKTTLTQTITNLPVFPSGASIMWIVNYRATKALPGTAKLILTFADGTKQNVTLPPSRFPKRTVWSEVSHSATLKKRNLVKIQVQIVHTSIGGSFEIDDVFLGFFVPNERNQDVLPFPTHP